MIELTTVGILAHPKRPRTAPVAEQIAAIFQQRGLDTWVYVQWDSETVQADVAKADLVVAIGGDGAMLRAARVCAPFQVPVLGINMGHLGFLTEINYTNGWERYIDRMLDGEYWIEERMMIHMTVHRGEKLIAEGDALNDVVISRNKATSMVVMETYIDKHWATTYHADALIISTATGSTAYALASGGPILPPQLRNILLAPVAPHLSMDRPIVLSEGSIVEVKISPSTTAEVAVTVDGAHVVDVEEGDTIVAYASENISRFIRLRGRNYFYRSLLDRMEPRVPMRTQPPENREIG